jgi:hypothetical protein
MNSSASAPWMRNLISNIRFHPTHLVEPWAAYWHQPGGVVEGEFVCACVCVCVWSLKSGVFQILRNFSERL